ncbi:glycosyltransferase family 2 protein [Candidatus Kaiserbacteria bacterium]|nr:glycosyltransferase family 2 protein [Candidatus Kaiserbacteria bacterium]
MEQNKRISVVMPVFNAERYVADAVQSVLNQTYGSIELICVDDGSTDASASVLRSFGDAITCIFLETNSGIAVARNTGAASASGAFLAFMDADDLWKEDKLALQSACFDENPAIDLVFTYMQCFISPELPAEVQELRELPVEPVVGHVPSAVLIKRSSFDRVGNFNPVWRVGEFIDWRARAVDAGLKEVTLPETLLLRRIHDRNTGVTERSSRVDYVRIVREALARRKNDHA